MKFKLQPYSIHELGQRANQEDSMFPAYQQSKPEDRLFILCDGMGGHEKGEVASATVCETMSKTILSRWNSDEPLSDELLQQAISDAYDALDEKDNGSEKKMGTTMTFVCFHADGVTVAHIGDSRIYQLRPANGNKQAIIVHQTKDHSLVQSLIDIGEITEEEAKTHPQKNVITRAMQPCQERRAKADIEHWNDVEVGDYFYICSDGMLEQTSDENLLYIITKQGIKNEKKVEMLRSVTEDNKDNHTAHLININKVEGKTFSTPIQNPLSFEETTRDPQQGTTSQGTWVAPEYEKPKKKSILPMVLSIIAVIAIAAWGYLYYVHTETEDKENSVEIDAQKMEEHRKAKPSTGKRQTKSTDQQSITSPTDNLSADKKAGNQNDVKTEGNVPDKVKPNTVTKFTNVGSKGSTLQQKSNSKEQQSAMSATDKATEKK